MVDLSEGSFAIAYSIHLNVTAIYDDADDYEYDMMGSMEELSIAEMMMAMMIVTMKIIVDFDSDDSDDDNSNMLYHSVISTVSIKSRL